MCGINGIFQFRRKFEIDKLSNYIGIMNQSIVHRGPDGEGVYVDETCALGMRRLSIIDLEKGDQPIWNDDRTKAIIFNGEIYNYQELRNNLLGKGIGFSTNSDTEVILKGIESEGISFINRLEGMFAFAIYDKKQQTVLLARDRLGEKPLYYAEDDGVLYFASELKSILSIGVIKKQINTIAFSQYLHLSYIPSPLTIIEGVYKLRPGYWMNMNSFGKTETIQYWDEHIDPKTIITDYDLGKELLRKSVEESVKKCMVADVPVGVFLSGGIDSGIVAGLMAQYSAKPISTFTLGFSEKEYDESKRAEIIVQKYKTDHHIKVVKSEDVFEALPTVIESMGEPFADQSIIVTYILSAFTRKYVKAVLTGDGGDELFAGYNRYLIEYYSQKYNEMPDPVKKMSDLVLRNIDGRTRLSRKVSKVIDNANLPLDVQRLNLMCLAFNKSTILGKDSEEIYRDIRNCYEKYIGVTDEINRILYTDLKVSLEGDMLAKVDRASMLASLETRVPLLGKNVVETSFMMPGTFKIAGRQQKKIFKEAFEDIIPNELRKKSKRGFDVPISKWIRNDLRTDMEKTISGGYAISEGMISKSAVNEMITRHILSLIHI